MVTQIAGTEYRYTEWVDFEARKNVGPWHRKVGIELYDHSSDIQGKIEITHARAVSPKKSRVNTSASTKLNGCIFWLSCRGTLGPAGRCIQENTNLADSADHAATVSAISAVLHKGPQTGGGWGPWDE